MNTTAPSPASALRRALYSGERFLLPATPASLALCNEVRRGIAAVVGTPIRAAADRMAPEDLFAAIGQVRLALYEAPHIHRLLAGVIAALNLDPKGFAIEPAKLRTVVSAGHKNPRAQAVYVAHRDTWYAHPQALITWWIPLDDLAAEETFVFYPQWFDQPVANGSNRFDADRWARGLRIGWQDRDAGLRAHYPHALDPPPLDSGQGFACQRAQNLLFSGAQLHQTRPQTTGQTRYSIDFRIVHRADHEAGLGAVNVDNRSRGSALAHYLDGARL